MAVAHAIGTRERGTTCRICGQPALPVVRLCAQCKAALKRVRHDTVSQHMPMARRPRGGDRARGGASRADADASVRKSAWRGARAPLALAALLAVVGSAGYFVVQQIHAAMPAEASGAANAGVDRVPLAASAPPPIVKAPEPQLFAPTDGLGAATGDAAPSAPVRPKVLARPVKPASTPIAVPVAEVRPESPPPPVVVATAPAPAVRPPDRMQLLAQAFAQCPADGVLARMVCEQKARVQYCDGYWGQAPQCPNGAPDRGLSH